MRWAKSPVKARLKFYANPLFIKNQDSQLKILRLCISTRTESRLRLENIFSIPNFPPDYNLTNSAEKKCIQVMQIIILFSHSASSFVRTFFVYF